MFPQPYRLPNVSIGERLAELAQLLCLYMLLALASNVFAYIELPIRLWTAASYPLALTLLDSWGHHVKLSNNQHENRESFLSGEGPWGFQLTVGGYASQEG